MQLFSFGRMIPSSDKFRYIGVVSADSPFNYARRVGHSSNLYTPDADVACTLPCETSSQAIRAADQLADEIRLQQVR